MRTEALKRAGAFRQTPNFLHAVKKIAARSGTAILSIQNDSGKPLVGTLPGDLFGGGCQPASDAWLEFGSYPPDEIAARFHHRLVTIHLFANGNGRNARTMTDLLLVQLLKRPRFTWGSGNLVDPGDVRRRYIDALRAADRGDYASLLLFVRS